MPEVNFPSDWVFCSISDIAQVNPKKIDAEPDTVSGFVPMSLAPVSFSDSFRYEEKYWKEINKSYTNFQNGDVIFAKVTPCFENGKAAIADGLPNGIGAGSSEFYVLRPHTPHVLPDILFALIKTQKFANDGVANMTGAVGLRRVPRAFVESFDAPMIPIAEQKVIAEKLGTLLAQVEATKVRLENTLETLKQFRQSVLAAAVSGKLTEDWRKSNRVESGYRSITLGDVINDGPQNGIYKPSTLYGSGTKIIRIDGFYDGELCSWESFKRVNVDQEEAEKWALKENDILINRVNSIEYLGKCGLVRTLPETAIFESNIMRVSIDENKARPEFIKIFLTSPKGLDSLRANAKLAVNQASINQQDVKSCPLDLPETNEQREIIRKVNLLLSGADSTELLVNQALERVNNLTQSILAKAFRGELTEQWRKENPELISGDNSAEALLAKIKAERETVKPKRKTKK
ncbi:restriction endonuclease subunit S [Vibrio sp. 3-2(1)]|uniref:restriction endonuclease subunit S n=1 Tax=Vibrio sp. 3-2(1) TaxID=2591016 RepID=UPI0014833BAB|nr:restriction endonuclease subunit S [Vibrio sp. 3-2(1)]NNN70553.1 type I restriction endonuclease subunit S [Vibrio sp. 3-2(1)]